MYMVHTIWGILYIICTYIYITRFFKFIRIVGCETKKQPDLSFDFTYGACNTFKFNELSPFELPEEKVLMCFDWGWGGSLHLKNCHMSVIVSIFS